MTPLPTRMSLRSTFRKTSFFLKCIQSVSCQQVEVTLFLFRSLLSCSCRFLWGNCVFAVKASLYLYLYSEEEWLFLLSGESSEGGSFSVTAVAVILHFPVFFLCLCPLPSIFPSVCVYVAWAWHSFPGPPDPSLITHTVSHQAHHLEVNLHWLFTHSLPDCSSLCDSTQAKLCLLLTLTFCFLVHCSIFLFTLCSKTSNQLLFHLLHQPGCLSFSLPIRQPHSAINIIFSLPATSHSSQSFVLIPFPFCNKLSSFQPRPLFVPCIWVPTSVHNIVRPALLSTPHRWCFISKYLSVIAQRKMWIDGVQSHKTHPAYVLFVHLYTHVLLI